MSRLETDYEKSNINFNILEKSIASNHNLMSKFLLEPQSTFSVIEQYMRFANRGTIDLSCFPHKHFGKIIKYHYKYWEQYFPTVVSNKTKIHNYKFIDFFMFAINSKFLCYGNRLLIHSNNIMEYMQIFERACYLYYPEILAESTFSDIEGKFVFEYKFFALAIYTAVLYSNCLFIRTMARIKKEDASKKDDVALVAKMTGLRQKVKCDDINMEDIGRFLRLIDKFERESEDYKLYVGSDFKSGGGRKKSFRRKRVLSKKKSRKYKTRKGKERKYKLRKNMTKKLR